MNSTKIGLDLGGTKLLGIVSTVPGKIDISEKSILPSAKTAKDIVNYMAEMVKKLSHDTNVEQVGISVPGPVDRHTDIVQSLPNIGLHDVPLSRLLEKKIHIPVKIGNDVNMASLAEFYFGAGKGLNSLFTLYPGTGLGGGYIRNGQLITGLNGTAGEAGHMVVEVDGHLCSCGQRGCLETIVSNVGFKRLLKEAVGEGKKDPFENMEISGQNIESLWHANNTVVQEILTYQARVSGIAAANIINLMGVDGVLIGGGVFRRLEKELLPVIIKTTRQYAIGNGFRGVTMRITALGPEAPALGATLL